MTDELKSLTTTCDLVSCIYLISKTGSNTLYPLYVQLNTSLKENDDSINSNIKIIDDRMTDLIQRMTALSSTDA